MSVEGSFPSVRLSRAQPWEPRHVDKPGVASKVGLVRGDQSGFMHPAIGKSTLGVDVRLSGGLTSTLALVIRQIHEGGRYSCGIS